MRNRYVQGRLMERLVVFLLVGAVGAVFVIGIGIVGMGIVALASSGWGCACGIDAQGRAWSQLPGDMKMSAYFRLPTRLSQPEVWAPQVEREGDADDGLIPDATSTEHGTTTVTVSP